jgi:glycosyltransferase involved in cell wall biosynthesis
MQSPEQIPGIPKRRIAVLLSAFACHPGSGSEPGVGWNLAIRLAREFDVTVLRGDLSEPPIGRKAAEEWIRRRGPQTGLEFEHVAAPRMALFLERLHRLPGLHFLYYLAYRLWQRAALVHARRLMSIRSFDLVHHLTMVGFREPGFLFRLGKPFCWGPIGGAANEPWSYMPSFGMRAAVGLSARRLANWLQMRFARRPREAARAASWIWAATPEDRDMIAAWGHEAELLPETGSELGAQRAPKARRAGEPLVLVWSGLHIARKCLPIALDALALLGPGSGVSLRVLGTGPETGRWKKRAESLGVEGAVEWRGWLPHEEALREMEGANAFLFTSVKEATSTVALEALSRGLPVLCHDACGMGVVVDDTCGIKIRLRGPKASARGFANAIARLRDESGLLERLSAGALRRAVDFTWDQKAEEIARVYRRVAGGHSNPAGFPGRLNS